MASEKDVEVLLVDGDFSKPEILSILGPRRRSRPDRRDRRPELGPGIFVIQTDIDAPFSAPRRAPGEQRHRASRLAAAPARCWTRSRPHPRRIVIFDSPPALVASPHHPCSKVGQIVMVVRADKTAKRTFARRSGSSPAATISA
jgi:hypothetical protein